MAPGGNWHHWTPLWESGDPQDTQAHGRREQLPAGEMDAALWGLGGFQSVCWLTSAPPPAGAVVTSADGRGVGRPCAQP